MPAWFTYVGGQGSPYRAPCGGWATPPKRFLAVPFSNYVIAENNIPRLQNTTDVDGYCSETTHIPPYTRGVTPCTPPPQCGPWCEPPIANTYAPYDPPQYLNLAKCRKLGFKYVVARKFWQGRFGYTAVDGCCTGTKPAPSSTPSNTKYRTLTINSNFHYDFQAGTSADMDLFTVTVQQTVSIDRYSGKYTITGCTYTEHHVQKHSDGTVFFDSTVDANLGTYAGVAAALAGLTDQVCQAAGSGDQTTDVLASNGSIGFPMTASGCGDAWTQTVSDTHYHHQFDNGYTFPNDGSGSCTGAHVYYTADGVLSDPYTSNDVNADADGLLGWWNLADDTQIPWRTDGNCTAGPLVTYFEEGDAPAFHLCTDVDMSPADGSVLGRPLPAGSDPYFNFRAIVYNPDSTINGYGEYAPSWAPNATQWTDAILLTTLFPGQFFAYNSLQGTGGRVSDDNLYKSKYAEVLTYTAPSHNFARPCGLKDAETRDQTTVDCTSDGMGGYVNQYGNHRWVGYPCFCNDPTQTTGCGTPLNPTAVDQWNDNQPKGQFCIATWNWNFRDDYANPSDPNYRPVTAALSSNECSQQCLPYTPCCPAVIYLTPNGESSANSLTVTASNLACDECYGALFNRLPRQWMTDPLWQPPARPCTLSSFDTEWSEDDGSGTCTGVDPVTGFSVVFYPQRPWEECLCSAPPGTPALPAGCYIHVLTVPELNAGTTTGVEIDPPAAGQCWMPWWAWAINRLNTVINGGGGCFSCDYADPLATCGDDTEVVP